MRDFLKATGYIYACGSASISYDNSPSGDGKRDGIVADLIAGHPSYAYVSYHCMNAVASKSQIAYAIHAG